LKYSDFLPCILLGGGGEGQDESIIQEWKDVQRRLGAKSSGCSEIKQR